MHIFGPQVGPIPLSQLDDNFIEATTFTAFGATAVARTAQDKMRDVICVFDFLSASEIASTVAGTLGLDITASYAAAIAACPNGATLLHPAGNYALSPYTIQKPINCVGYNTGARGTAGAYEGGTRFTAAPGSTGYLCTISKAASPLDEELQLYGVNFRGIELYGSERGAAIGAFKISNLDYALWEDVYIHSFQLEALNFFTECRESTFIKVKARYCGDLDQSVPMINLREQNAASVDAHNNLTFIDCQTVFAYGNHIEIGSIAAGAPGQVREIRFLGGVGHGLVATSGIHPWNPTAGQQAFKHLLLTAGAGPGIESIGRRFHGGGNAVANIHIDATATAAELSLVGGTVTGAHLTTAAEGINVEAGFVSLNGPEIYNHTMAIVQTGGIVEGSWDEGLVGNSLVSTVLKTGRRKMVGTFLMNQGGLTGLASLEQNSNAAMLIDNTGVAGGTAISLRTKNSAGALLNNLFIQSAAAGSQGSGYVGITADNPLRMAISAVNPPSIVQDGEIKTYFKGTKFIVMFKNVTNTYFNILELTTGVWSNSTTPP